MWPLTLFLFVIGVAVGCSAFLSANKQVFSAEAEVLVLNETENLVGANDYLYLAKGDSVTKQTNNDNCSAQITQAGNILDLVATCSSSSEEAENYLKNLDYIYQYRPLFTGRNPYSYIFIYNCNYRNRILSYFISFTLGFSFLAVVPGIKLKVVSNMGKRTLQVYVFHMFFIKLMQGFGLFDYLHMEFGKLFVILYLIIAVVLTFFLSLRKWGNVFRLFEENIFIKNIE